MLMYAESLPAVSVDFEGRHLDGHYRVAGTSVIAYYADQVKSAGLDPAVPADRIAQWLLKDMAARGRHA
jgi:hypothetical protein